MDSKTFATTSSRDAISWLPDELLGNILSLLPTKHAASTSILAKRWKNVYRLVDNLDFDDSLSGEVKLERDVLLESTRIFFESDDGYVVVEHKLSKYMFSESFKNFVDRTLTLQGDYPIKKFSLKCHVGEENDCQKACVRRWISNVVERGVLELDLRITDRGLHFMPSQLLSCKTLVKLTLGTQLNLGKLPSYVSFPSLKTLFIDTVCFQYDDLCCVLLAGCPVLEELSVHHKDFEGTPYTISSPTVKRLSINYYCDDREELSLNLPNLVYLEYSDFALAEYPQVNLESLVEAKLELYPVRIHKWTTVLTNLFLGITNIKILHLSPVSVDVISRCVKRRLLLPVFNNLVNLSFGSNNMNKQGWELLVYLLQQSPELETLIIQDLNGYRGEDVSMPRNKVKTLHILGYRETVESLKQLKSFVGEFKCLEAVQVDVVEEDDVLQIKRDLKMLLGVSLPSKCLFKVT